MKRLLLAGLPVLIVIMSLPFVVTLMVVMTTTAGAECHTQTSETAPAELGDLGGRLELVTEPGGVRAYFVKALSGERGEVKARVFDLTATQLSDDVVLVTAGWQSERTQGGVMTTNGPSRNTSVMHKRGERWFIVQFHNSWKPK